MFIFHQTSHPVASSILDALQVLTPDALDGLAQSYGGWDYDLDATGHADKNATFTSGTRSRDRADGSSTAQNDAAGQPIPPFLPNVN